jgi:hypothetical protein
MIRDEHGFSSKLPNLVRQTRMGPLDFLFVLGWTDRRHHRGIVGFGSSIMLMPVLVVFGSPASRADHGDRRGRGQPLAHPRVVAQVDGAHARLIP